MSITTPEHDKRIGELTFASVYPHYLTKVESKGRTKEELLEEIEWNPLCILNQRKHRYQSLFGIRLVSLI